MHKNIQFFFRWFIFNNIIFCNIYAAETNRVKPSLARHVVSIGALMLNHRSVSTDQVVREFAKEKCDAFIAHACTLPGKAHNLALTYPKITGVAAGIVLAGTINVLGGSKKDAAIVGIASGSGAAVLFRYGAAARAVYNNGLQLKQVAQEGLEKAKEQVQAAGEDLQVARQNNLQAKEQLAKSVRAFSIAKALSISATQQKEAVVNLSESITKHGRQVADGSDLAQAISTKSKDILSALNTRGFDSTGGTVA